MVENQELVIGTDIIGLHDQKYGHVNETVINGKRTKSQRPPSPLSLTMATGSGSTSSSFNGGVGYNENLAFGVQDHHPTVSPISFDCSSSSSIEWVENVREEEEDMANCLILLAQGNQSNNQVKRAYSSQESNDTIISIKNNSKVFCDSYKCKTCDRSFPSFQALGGHRASHKKLPKTNTGDSHKKFLSLNLMENCISEHDKFNVIATTSLSLQIPCNGDVSTSGKSKIHECSICRAKFSSGQALGGHMRRHRPIVPIGSTSTTTTMASQSIDGGQQQEEVHKRPKNMLQLDLNLPAPEDRESTYALSSKKQVLVLSSSPWVDCHY